MDCCRRRLDRGEHLSAPRGSRCKRVPSGVPIKDAVDDTIHCVFYLCIGIGTRMIKSQYAGGILLQAVQKLVATLIFARPPQGQKCKRVPSGVPPPSGRLQSLSRFADSSLCTREPLLLRNICAHMSRKAHILI